MAKPFFQVSELESTSAACEVALLDYTDGGFTSKSCCKSVQVLPRMYHAAVQHVSQVVVDCATQTDVTSCLCGEVSDCDSACTNDSNGGSVYIPSSHDSDEDDEDSAPCSLRPVRVCLAYEDSLLLLLRFCPTCGSAVLQESLVTRYDGTMFCATGSCLHGCEFQWSSQPTIASRQRTGRGNFELAAAIALSGSTYGVVEVIASCMGLGLFSHTTFDAIQQQFVAPAVFSCWHAQQTVLIQDMAARSLVRLSGNGRSDSPGFSSKYMTYSLLDCDSNHVVMGRTMQLGQESDSSVGMEKVALESCLDQLLGHGVPVSVLTTDRSPSIIGVMKTKYEQVSHQHDIWHIAKSVKKHILAKAKGKELECLKNWVRCVVNHMYYCAHNCNGQPDILVELWRSLEFHAAGVHKWPLDGVTFKSINACCHGDLEAAERELAGEGRAFSYLEANSDAHVALKKVSSTFVSS